MKNSTKSYEGWIVLRNIVFWIVLSLVGAFALKYWVRPIGASYHVGTLLLLALLIAFLIFLFHNLKSSTVLVFFLASLLALILFDKSLFDYANWLHRQASSPTIFMIVLFGGALMLISRNDLIEELKKDKDSDKLKKEVNTFCLLQRFAKWVKHKFQADNKINSIAKFFLTLIPVLANFVSSAVAVLFFKSLWVPDVSDFVSNEQNRRRAAGILCLCVSGCLFVFTPWLKSTWWIFFDSTVASENLMPLIPVAVLLYAFLSYCHGYILIFSGSQETQEETPPDDGQSDINNPLLYLMVLAVCIIAISVSMAVIARHGSAPSDKTASPAGLSQSAGTVSEPSSAQTQASGTVKSDKQMSDSDKIKLTVCAVFLGLILAFLIAQILMCRCHVEPNDETWTAASYGNLLLKGMSNVFNTVLVLIVILAFKDIIVDALPDSAEFTSADSWGWKAGFTLAALLLTGVGYWIGSSFGVFALGFTVFSIAGVTDPRFYRTVIEALIISATFWNQRSPQADNVQMMLGNDNSTKGEVNRV